MEGAILNIINWPLSFKRFNYRKELLKVRPHRLNHLIKKPYSILFFHFNFIYDRAQMAHSCFLAFDHILYPK